MCLSKCVKRLLVGCLCITTVFCAYKNARLQSARVITSTHFKMNADTAPSERIPATESFGPFGLIRPADKADNPSITERSVKGPVNIRERWIHEKKNSDSKRSPHVSDKIIFFCQVVLIYGVVLASIINLAIDPQGKNRDLWSALLFSSIGYLLPSPTIKRSKDRPPSLPN